MGWVPFALVSVVIAVPAIAVRRRHISPDSDAGIEAGAVSETWLEQQRGNKNDE